MIQEIGKVKRMEDVDQIYLPGEIEIEKAKKEGRMEYLYPLNDGNVWLELDVVRYSLSLRRNRSCVLIDLHDLFT